jgi:hypothetical protein
VGGDSGSAAQWRSAFYARLNQILDKTDFDAYVESLCERFYADEIERPGLPPGRYFCLLVVRPFRRAVARQTKLSQCPMCPMHSYPNRF